MSMTDSAPANEKRDIERDRAMCEAATKFNYTLGIWQNEAARAECYAALPHYLTRTVEAEARVAELEAQVERLIGRLVAAGECSSPGKCPYFLNSDPPDKVCAACWDEWAMRKEDEAK